MAGSWNHATEQGRLIDPERFSGMIENLGDAYEMAEEMVGMVWWLATRVSEDPKREIEDARRHYKDGLRLAGQGEPNT